MESDVYMDVPAIPIASAQSKIRKGDILVVWSGPKWVSLMYASKRRQIESLSEKGVEEKCKIACKDLLKLGDGSFEKGICSFIKRCGFTPKKVVTPPDEDGIRDTFYRVT